MAALSQNDILNALRRISDPKSGRDVVSAGMISGVTLRGGRAGFILSVEPDFPGKDALREHCEQAVRAVGGVEEVAAVLTAEKTAAAAPPLKPAQWNREKVSQVRRLIAIASGKGGVGKSTVSVNLALAAAELGRRTGLLDADIYGPSLPRMLGISGQPEIEDGKMLPKPAHGVACMSIGLITQEAAVLRGPMISKTLHQMLRGTRWAGEEAPLDTLFIDTPPGTGDIHLSLAQQAPLDGAIIVTTPQDVALEDARKCAAMFGKLGVPLLGVIENMSWFDDGAGGKHFLFGQGGGQKLAEAFSIPLLGRIPLLPALREAADAGVPAAASYREAFAGIARALSSLDPRPSPLN